MASGRVKTACIDARALGGAAASLSRSAARRFAASQPGPGTASANNKRFWAPLLRAAILSASVGGAGRWAGFKTPSSLSAALLMAAIWPVGHWE